MSLGAWIAWACAAAALAIDIAAIILEQRRINGVIADLDETDDQVRNLLAENSELRDHVEALTAFVTKQDDEQPTGRHADSGEIRTSYVRVDG